MAGDDRPYEEAVEAPGIPVELPSGATFYVITEQEREHLEKISSRYLSDNSFHNIADMLDIDKLVSFELLVHRWNLWVSVGRNYMDEELEEQVKIYAELAEKYSGEIRQLKKAVGVDKTTRDKTSGDDSPAARWDNLLRRAKQFGYKRNQEAEQAVTSMHRIASVITFYRNADEQERNEFAFNLDDVIVVIEEEVKLYKEIDEEFRHNVQSTWVRDQ